MTTRANLAFAIAIMSSFAFGQNSPTPSPAVTPEQSPLLAVSPSESATPSPTPEQSPSVLPVRNVRISFVPPPLEGTISLGIYDKTGKLVRVLHQNAQLNDFSIGPDALVTRWDGRDDEGQDLPSGKYHARGFAVGKELETKHIGFFFNDWITDGRSPQINSIDSLWRDKAGSIQFRATVNDSNAQYLEIVINEDTGAITGVRSPISGIHCDQFYSGPNITHPIDCAFGKDHTVWAIDEVEKDTAREVKQLTANDKLIRRLIFPRGEPLPESIEVSLNQDKIFLIEKNEIIQRLRALTLLDAKNESGNPISNYEVDFEKNIVKHDGFTIENGKAIPRSDGKPVPEGISVKLVSNPLGGTRSLLDVGAGFNGKGSFLRTTDGLPLFTVDRNPKVVRVLITKSGEKSADVWQDDGAVVKQFRISNIDQMMAFDCGPVKLR